MNIYVEDLVYPDDEAALPDGVTVRFEMETCKICVTADGDKLRIYKIATDHRIDSDVIAVNPISSNVVYIK